MRPPQGWKWRIVGKERYIVSPGILCIVYYILYIVSPEGEMFKSIEKALAQMVKFRMPEDQVQIYNIGERKIQKQPQLPPWGN